MKTSSCLAAAAIASMLIGSAAHAQPAMTVDRAREIIAPLYATFTQPVAGDVKALLDKATTADWQSCTADNECRGRDESVKVFLGFGRAMPNMRHVIRDVIVSGDVVVVRGELSGTPAGEFFGVPHTGRSFSIMTMDMHVVKDGRLSRTFHVEDWSAAMRQLSKP